MAMTKCSECKKEISTQAKVCPHCGKPNPVEKKVGVGGFLVAVVILGWIVVHVANNDSSPSPSKGDTSDQTPPPPPKLSDADCQKDLQCWADRHQIDATVACKPQIENYAKNNFEWTDGMFTPTFDRIGFSKLGAHAITYAGTQVKFQNGFGAWTIMRYMCIWDPDKKQVLDVVVAPKNR